MIYTYYLCGDVELDTLDEGATPVLCSVTEDGNDLTSTLTLYHDGPVQARPGKGPRERYSAAYEAAVARLEQFSYTTYPEIKVTGRILRTECEGGGHPEVVTNVWDIYNDHDWTLLGL